LEWKLRRFQTQRERSVSEDKGITPSVRNAFFVELPTKMRVSQNANSSRIELSPPG
jgi:hypothetical protein